MTMRSFSTLAVAIGLCLGGTAVAQQAKTPTVAPKADDSKLVSTIAERLNQSAVTRGTDISVSSKDGIVTVLGNAENSAQKQAVLQVIQYTRGVVAVRDGVKVSKVKQTQAPGSDIPNTLPNMAPDQPIIPTPLIPNTVGPIVSQPEIVIQPSMPVVGSPVVEPMPLGAAGMGGPAMAGGAPPLPPYAWPTYAPTTTTSRVSLIRKATRTTPSRSSGRTTPSPRYHSAGEAFALSLTMASGG